MSSDTSLLLYTSASIGCSSIYTGGSWDCSCICRHFPSDLKVFSTQGTCTCTFHQLSCPSAFVTVFPRVGQELKQFSCAFHYPKCTYQPQLMTIYTEIPSSLLWCESLELIYFQDLHHQTHPCPIRSWLLPLLLLLFQAGKTALLHWQLHQHRFWHCGD